VSGENPNARKAMDALIKAQREQGVSPREAEKRARDAALRHDRREGK
jgi:hypothetical protein